MRSAMGAAMTVMAGPLVGGRRSEARQAELVGVHDAGRGMRRVVVQEGRDILEAVRRGPHRPAAQDGDDVGGRQSRHALACPGRRRAEVRHENDVVELFEAGRHGRLPLVDVETGAEAGCERQCGTRAASSRSGPRLALTSTASSFMAPARPHR